MWLSNLTAPHTYILTIESELLFVCVCVSACAYVWRVYDMIV